jgi:hypothetical protein
VNNDHQHHHRDSAPASAQDRGAHDHASMMADPGMARGMEKDMRRRFWVALAFTIPVALLAGNVPGVPML